MFPSREKLSQKWSTVVKYIMRYLASCAENELCSLLSFYIHHLSLSFLQL